MEKVLLKFINARTSSRGEDFKFIETLIYRISD
jgi:hypothetical protein